jgi:signal transduction histidine kinase/CheY-like chemotaxis protein
MKRATIIAIFLLILTGVANYIYFSSLYRNQIRYISDLLDRQVQMTGQEVDEFNTFITSDLSKIDFSEDISSFFDDPEVYRRATERLKLYYIKYQDFITSISLINNKSDVFNMTLDETREGFRRGVFTSEDYWLINRFQTHEQQKIYEQDILTEEGSRTNYYQPVVDKTGKVVANFRISVDHDKYFTYLFEKFKAEQYQWQWLVNEAGEILQDNLAVAYPGKRINYQNIDRIISSITDGSTGNLRHRVDIDNESKTIISSYCPVSLLAGMEYGIVFSAPTDFFQSFIIRNSTTIGGLNLVMILLIIILFRISSKRERSDMINTREAENMLNRLIDEIPVGVVIYNSEREILKANRLSAELYDYNNEEEMTGETFPQPGISDKSDYFSKNLGGKFSPELFVIIPGETGEKVLFRSSIPLEYMGQEAAMDILIDVTILESARKQEELANISKTEFLARMSYEIRTPLNGIIGMTDMLASYKLDSKVAEMVRMLRRSSELLLGIINDILDFSNIELGRMIIDEVPFNLHHELGFCIDLAYTRLEGKDINLSCDIADDVPERVIGDPYRLRQVLSGLTQFAVQSTETGSVLLRCSRKSTDDGIITLEFDMRDTGRGYDKTELKNFFGDILHEVSPGTESGSGINLGTALAKQMIEIMGGKLIASSPSGLTDDSERPGTRLVFTVKVYSDDQFKKAYETESIRSLRDINALIITGMQSRDEEVYALFHKMGINASVTTYNKSTINQIKANYQTADERYNLLVIMDDEDINGFEVADSIMQSSLHLKYAILMVSAMDVKGNYLKCRKMGVDHYIVKPVGEEDLRGALIASFPSLPGKAYHISGKTRSNINILIVEDNELNSKVIGEMLRLLGHDPDFAKNGVEACSMTESKTYDIIFMDLIMPDMNGYEASREILSGNSEVIIVALTADTLTDSRKKAEMSGIVEFIGKPVRIDQLRSVLKKYFEVSGTDVS